MARKGFPWVHGAFTAPFWQGRHTRMGDTIPPGRTPGPPSATNSLPFSEAMPSGLPGGYYDDEARGVGYHEPPHAEKINRPVYDLSCALDAFAQQEDAILYAWFANALGPGPAVSLDLLDPAWDNGAVPNNNPPVIFTGPEFTTDFTGGNLFLRCSNFVGIRDGMGRPFIDPVSGHMVHVTDVLSAPGGSSLYWGAIRPSWAQTFPIGSFGLVDTVASTGPGTSSITFTGDIPPSGTPAVGSPVCFFNYSRWERLMRDGGQLPMHGPYAICTVSAGVAPTTYSLNRDATLADADWHSGDVIYTTYIAYRPTLLLEASTTFDPNMQVMGGAPYPKFFTQAESCMMTARSYLDPFSVLPLPLEIEEPPATPGLRDFDYANALIRAKDGTLKGTTLFDARGSGYSPGKAWDPFAGFLHRKLIEFTAGGGPTQLPFDAQCGLFAGTITLVNVPPDQFQNVGGDTHLIPGIDLVELTDANTGELVGLFVLRAITGMATATIRELNGVAPAVGVANATIRIYRTYFLSAADGDWGGTADDARWRAAGLFVGEALGTGDKDQAIPLALHAAGTNYLLQGYQGPWDSRNGGLGVGPYSSKIFEVASRILGGTRYPGDIGFGVLDDTPITGWVLGSRQEEVKITAVPQYTRKHESKLWPDDIFDNGGGVHSGGYPKFRLITYSLAAALASPTLNTVGMAALQIEPDADNGIDFGGNPARAASLYLGGGIDDLIGLDPAGHNPANAPTIGFVTARGDGPTTAQFIAGIHRNTAAVADDMYFRLYEGALASPLFPEVEPAYCRFEVAWDSSGSEPAGKAPSKFNYGWPEKRSFHHDIPLVTGQCSLGVGGPFIWYYSYDIFGAPPPAAGWGCPATVGEAYVEFPIRVPDGATIKEVRMIWNQNGVGANRTARWWVFCSTLDFETNPPTAASAFQKPLHTPGAGAYDVAGALPLGTGWELSTYVADGFGTTDATNKMNRSYFVRVANCDNLTTVAILGLRVLYEMQDFLPA